MTDFIVKKINYDWLFEQFIKIFPEFKVVWEKYLDSTNSDKERLIYIDISVFVHFIIKLLRENKTEDFHNFFLFFEEQLSSIENNFQEILVVGFLEDVQNILSNETKLYKEIIKYFGPKTMLAWNYLEKIWEGKENLMDVFREENKSQKK